MRSVIDLVGPEGYIHGWIKVAPGQDHAAALRSMSPAEKKAYVRNGTLPERLKPGSARTPVAPPQRPAAVKTAAAPAKVAVRGASVPASARTATPANLRVLIRAKGNADVKREVGPLFDGKYGNFTVRTESAVRHDGSIHAEGKIYDPRGKVAGLFERDIHDQGYLGLVVHNTLLELHPQYQGQGFASEFYKRTEANLKAAGVKEAGVKANLDVGGYAWARKGFDWQTPGVGQHAIGQFATWYEHANGTPKAASDLNGLVQRARDTSSRDFPTPYDLSQVGYTPGATTWPGKTFMLAYGRAVGWMGLKKL